jgi:hypothetical protein
MSEIKHTPGPWTFSVCEIGHENNRLNHVVGSECGNYIARLFSEQSTLPGMTSLGPDNDTAIANAKLIAAAPEMFVLLGNAHELLHKVRGFISDQDDAHRELGEMMQQIRTVLAKTT